MKIHTVNHSPAPARGQGESGYALIMTLLIMMLLIAIIKPLIFEVQRESQVARNILAMRHMEYAAREAFKEALDVLEQDFPEQGGGESGGAGLPGASGSGGGDTSSAMQALGAIGAQAPGSGAEGAAGGPGQEEEEPPSDSFNQDSLRLHRMELERDQGLEENVPNWVIAQSPNSESYERDNIRVKTFIYIEDENRKLNILPLAHREDKISDEALDQLERLLDWVREDRYGSGLESNFQSRPVAEAMREWLRKKTYRALDGEVYMRPLLLSNAKKNGENDANDETTLPLTLGELKEAIGDRLDVPESTWQEIWIDTLDDEMKIHPGLESLLTVHTSLHEEPIQEDELGNYVPDDEGMGGAGGPARAPSAASARRSAPAAGAQSGAGSGADSGVSRIPAAEDSQPLININTAPWAVLRALAPKDAVPDTVIDAILEYRNEVDEERLQKMREEEQEETQFSQSRSRTDVMSGMEGDEHQPRRVFSSLEMLEEKIESFKALDPKAKSDFTRFLTTTSEVFSIWVTVTCRPNGNHDEMEDDLFKRSEDASALAEQSLDIKPGEIVRRFRKLVWRRPASDTELSDSGVEFLAIIPWEERSERKFAIQEDPNKDYL